MSTIIINKNLTWAFYLATHPGGAYFLHWEETAFVILCHTRVFLRKLIQSWIISIILLCSFVLNVQKNIDTFAKHLSLTFLTALHVTICKAKTCCFWCWISHWVLLILSWNMWLRGRSGGLWLGRDPGGVGGSVKIGDWVFDLVGIFPWLRSFGLTFRLLVLREYSYLGVYLSAVTIWSLPFVLVSCC